MNNDAYNLLLALHFDFCLLNIDFAHMDAFYTPRTFITGSQLLIRDEEHHHLSHVMRKKIGDELFVSDGEGTMYRVNISAINREQTQCDINDWLPNYNELNREIILVQALLKNPSKVDWIIEKATELGVAKIIPIITERTLTSQAKIDRWRHIALSAMKQSMRCMLPFISDVQSFQQVLIETARSSIFLFHESADSVQTISSEIHKLQNHTSIAIIIGPEGGFTEQEIEIALKNKAKILSLGKTRLRSETAAIAAIARITELI